MFQATGYRFGAGTPFIGASTNISSAVMPFVDFSYFLTRDWAIETICYVAAQRHQRGPAAGATAWTTTYSVSITPCLGGV